jgi:predicted MFS family arabinose efflux permease
LASLSGAEAPRFTRDRLTWLAYVSVSSYGFYVYALGPVLAFLHQELHLSYTLTSVHSTLWAAGSVVAGLSLHRLARRLGRHRVFWLAVATTAVGAFLFIAGHSVVITLPAALILGTGCTLVGAVSSVVLADRHGRYRDRALVEGNLAASGVGVLVPALLGLLALTAAGWRTGLVLPVLALGTAFFVFRRVPMPSPSEDASLPGRLPRGFWGPCLLVALAVGMEYCVLFYAVPLLRIGARLSTADAAAALSLFVAGEFSGRLGGAWLTRRPGQTARLIGAALAVAMAGFLVLWLIRLTAVAVVGLFVTGVGIGNLYPLSLALALGAGRGRTDQAMSRVQVSVGVAIGTAPLLLGVLSDHVGVLRALTVEPALIVAAAVVLLVVVRGGRGEPATAAAA